MSAMKTNNGGKTVQADWRSHLGSYVLALHCSPDGARIAAASVDGPIILLDSVSGKEIIRLPGHKSGTMSIDWHPGSRTLLSTGQDGQATLWDTNDGVPIFSVAAGSAWVTKGLIHPDGTQFVTAAGRTLRSWSMDGTLLFEETGHPSTIADMQWMPGAASLVTAAYGGLHRRDASTIALLKEFLWKGSSLVIAPSPTGKYIATGDQDSTVHFWITETGDDLHMSGYETKVKELSWNRTGRFLATGGGSAAVVWDCSGKGPEGSRPTMHAMTAKVTAVAFQRTSDHLAIGDATGTMKIVRPQDDKRPVREFRSGAGISALTWSSDDRNVIVGTNDGSIISVRM